MSTSSTSHMSLHSIAADYHFRHSTGGNYDDQQQQQQHSIQQHYYHPYNDNNNDDQQNDSSSRGGALNDDDEPHVITLVPQCTVSQSPVKSRSRTWSHGTGLDVTTTTGRDDGAGTTALLRSQHRQRLRPHASFSASQQRTHQQLQQQQQHPLERLRSHASFSASQQRTHQLLQQQMQQQQHLSSSTMPNNSRYPPPPVAPATPYNSYYNHLHPNGGGNDFAGMNLSSSNNSGSSTSGGQLLPTITAHHVKRSRAVVIRYGPLLIGLAVLFSIPMFLLSVSEKTMNRSEVIHENIPVGRFAGNPAVVKKPNALYDKEADGALEEFIDNNNININDINNVQLQQKQQQQPRKQRERKYSDEKYYRDATLAIHPVMETANAKCEVHTVQLLTSGGVAGRVVTDWLVMEEKRHRVMVAVVDENQDWMVLSQRQYAIPARNAPTMDSADGTTSSTDSVEDDIYHHLTPVQGYIRENVVAAAATTTKTSEDGTVVQEQQQQQQQPQYETHLDAARRIVLEELGMTSVQAQYETGTDDSAFWTFLGRYRTMADHGGGFTYCYLLRSAVPAIRPSPDGAEPAVALPAVTAFGDRPTVIRMSLSELRQAIAEDHLFQDIQGVATMSLAIQYYTRP